MSKAGKVGTLTLLAFAILAGPVAYSTSEPSVTIASLFVSMAGGVVAGLATATAVYWINGE